MHSGNEIFLQPFAPIAELTPLPVEFAAAAHVSVLRLDAPDPLLSGNKWYKLRYYLADALASGRSIVTWGGAWSNHIIATATACRRAGIPCVGIIRGERPPRLSATLLMAAEAGMELFFMSRSEYAAKKTPAGFPADRFLEVPEGGYGDTGAKGAATITGQYGGQHFTHIFCAVGTGTTLAGLVRGSSPSQFITGIPVLKDHSLREGISSLLGAQQNWQLIYGYERGGYAKHDPALIAFMNSFFTRTGIPTDFVYTGKLFMAVASLLADGFLPAGSRALVIHSGGLQGNRGLPAGTLLF